MSEKKTIRISPDLLRFSTTNKTRKKQRSLNPSKPIKLKSGSNPHSSKTVKNRFLKYIREQQSKNYKSNFELPDKPKPENPTAPSGFTSDFEDSLKCLTSIFEKSQPSISSNYKNRHNSTLRQLPPTTESLLYGSTTPIDSPYANVGMDLPDVFNMGDMSTKLGIENPLFLQKPIRQVPKYGCLKNGTLPTYKMWKNQTLRSPQNGGDRLPSPVSLSNSPTPTPTMYNNSNVVPTTIDSFSFRNVGGKKDISEMKQHHERKKAFQRPKPLFQKLKQKRTLRRTYRVGRSKHHPNVAVLISNKTLRKQITTKTQLLKQVPMEDVKKTLIKKGFIKVGSTAPPDVLRKMYETVSLVCGDIQNHNPENLLYNYLNGGDDA